MTTDEAILYLFNLPLPPLLDNSEEACIEHNKYIIAIKMGMEALLLYKEQK